MERYSLEVREPGRSPRAVEVDGQLEAGRETDGLVLPDSEASRRHLTLRSHRGNLAV